MTLSEKMKFNSTHKAKKERGETGASLQGRKTRYLVSVTDIEAAASSSVTNREKKVGEKKISFLFLSKRGRD